MGNCFARNQVGRPLEYDRGDVESSLIDPSSNNLRIKVRMTTTQLLELMAQVDLSRGNSELGQMILQECLEGRLRARVVLGDQGFVSSERAKDLWTIKEE